MKCPVCHAWTYNLETRTNQDGTVRRRYECGNLHRFSTLETLFRVIKPKNQKLEAEPGLLLSDGSQGRASLKNRQSQTVSQL
jgi:transcriptional regulator NrdR family protein